MANTRPYTEAHAVAWVDIALFLDGKLSADQRDDLRAAFKTALEAEGFVAGKSRDKSAVTFKRNGIAGEVVDELHIHETFVHIKSNEYRGWTFTRDMAIKRFGPLFARLKNGRIKVSGIGLAYRDAFLCDTPKNYDVSDVFRLENRFLPAAVLTSGNRWKQEVSLPGGAFADNPLKISTTLTIEAKVTSSDDEEAVSRELHATEITHSLTIRWNKSAASVVKWSEIRFRNLLDSLHQQNKSVLLELLSEEMIDKIGLKE